MNLKDTKFYHFLSIKKKQLQLLLFRALQLFLPMKILWFLFAQKGELEFHINNAWRQTDDFMENSKELFEGVGYSDNSFADKVILDMGNGSKLRSAFFKGAKIIAIDPLNQQFIENIEWSDVKTAFKVFSVPAEEMVDEIENTVDFAMCINVLDHTYKPIQILKNIHDYLKPDGEFFLSVDLNDEIPNAKHPVPLNEKRLEKMFVEVGLRVKRKSQYHSNKGKTAYGSGQGKAINYILIK